MISVQKFARDWTDFIVLQHMTKYHARDYFNNVEMLDAAYCSYVLEYEDVNSYARFGALANSVQSAAKKQKAMKSRRFLLSYLQYQSRNDGSFEIIKAFISSKCWREKSSIPSQSRLLLLLLPLWCMNVAMKIIKFLFLENY